MSFITSFNQVKPCMVVGSPQSVLLTDVHDAAAGKHDDNLVLPPPQQNSTLNPPVAQSTTTCSNTSLLGREWSLFPASVESHRTQNPIRAVVDPIMSSYRRQNCCKKNEDQDGNQQPVDVTEKEFISLALGDPTSSGNFEPCPIVQEDIVSALVKSTAGYVNALGTDNMRQAIANFHSSWSAAAIKHHLKLVPVDASHVVVASGCSGALDLVLKALLDPGTYLLVPNPGFPLYQVICQSKGAYVIPYDLLPSQDWQMDPSQVMRLIQFHRSKGNEIRGMLVNNPSNPTGAVYSHEHLKDIVQLCETCRLPLIADEIYGDLTYLEDRPFLPLANVVADMESQVPVITCSGIGKQFLVPGWRVGWAAFQDNAAGSLSQVEKGAKQLAQIVLGASHLAQTIAVQILTSLDSPEMMSWQQTMRTTLATNAKFMAEQLSQAPGLRVSRAQGAMYTMVTLENGAFDFLTAHECDSSLLPSSSAGELFTTRLLEEDQVFVLPGSCFGMPNAFRLVFCAPAPALAEACDRIVKFCQRHAVYRD